MSMPKDIIQRSKRSKASSTLQFPEKLGSHSMLLVFNKYSYQRPGTRALNKLSAGTTSSLNTTGTDSILLPLPANIEDTYSVRVQGADIGFSGENVAAAAATVANKSDISFAELRSALGQLIPEGSALFNSIIGNATQEQAVNAAFLARRGLDSKLAGASRAVDIGLGNTINPKAALYFDGMTLKQPNFSWTLAPTNASESDTLRDISNTIKRNILPSYGSAGGVARSLLNYPSMVDIYFLGIDQAYFAYYKTCMVQTFSTNFTPQGLAFVKGGKPAMITMNMGLIEADIHTAEDYGGGGGISGEAARSWEKSGPI